MTSSSTSTSTGVNWSRKGPGWIERPTIVALHGGPGADHSVFKPVFRAATEFAQVVYLDQRGSGRSDRGDPESWTWDRWADDVVDFCDALDITDPILVGTSSGGWVALITALRHPERVGKLVLDSAMPGPVEERLAIFERLGGSEAGEVARRYLPESVQRTSARRGSASVFRSTPASPAATRMAPTGCAGSRGTTTSSNTSGTFSSRSSTPGTGSTR